MSFPDLLEFNLNLLDTLILEVLNFLESVFDDTESLRIDLCGSKQLVDLRVLSLKGFLDSLELLLLDEVAEASLLMDLVHMVME